jgi:septal ring factor EnvC (AmiA/AmiB activator)
MALRWIVVPAALLACLFLLTPSAAQRSSREISSREKELKQLRNDIQAFERKLKESEKKERSTLDRLDDLERQAGLIQQLIRRLREEELQITTDIDTARTGIADLEQQLQYLKMHYANYVRSVYKNGRVYDLEALFSSKSINQMYIRVQYLRRFSEQRAKDLLEIMVHKQSLESKNSELQQKLVSERQVLEDKTQEEATLRKKYDERQQVLRRIRKDKTTYARELARKTEAFRQIERLIADLIEKERVRKEKEKEDTERRERELANTRERERTVPVPTAVTPSPASSFFAERKGKLRWPTQSGTIRARFGNHVHPVLRTVTENAGIDIATPQGSNVYAVADGEVAVVSFIPGFGNLIIVNHYNGYRTVYAHLSDVLVSESQKIREGTVIARSGETVDQPLLHFEVWKEREKQNPEHWLASRR